MSTEAAFWYFTLLGLCAGQWVTRWWTPPKYGLRKKKGGVSVDEFANVDDDYDGPDDWDPWQCSECQRWTEHGHFSELDDSFVCDDCAIGATHAYGGDCV